MPSASPSQYICSLIEEMDQNSLQPVYGIDEIHMDAYQDCRNTYVQNNVNIDEYLCEYHSETENPHLQGNCYRNQSGTGVTEPQSWNYPHNPRQSNLTCTSNEPSSQLLYSNSYHCVTNFDKTRNCCGVTNFQNKQRQTDFERNPICSSVPVPRQENSEHLNQRITPQLEPNYMHWTSKHPQNWSPKEVLDWLFYTADKHQVDCGMLHAENFQSVSGADLCKMGLDDFYRLEQNFGRLFFDLFRALCDGLPFKNPTEGRSCDPTDLDDSSSSSISLSPTPSHLNIESASRSYENIDYSHCGEGIKMEQTDSVFYDVPQQPQPQPTGYMCGRMASPPTMQHCAAYQLRQQPCLVTENQCMYQNYCATPTLPPHCIMPGDLAPAQIPRRRPGRPRIKSLPTEEEAQREKKGKNQHLWEFIYEILMNPLYNPQYLRWENQREGVFRFVQSEAVAQLWGSLKNNENMTYEKLSRAMRHYYKRGILERVEGRRLVYKFSTVAMERVREKRFSV